MNNIALKYNHCDALTDAVFKTMVAGTWEDVVCGTKLLQITQSLHGGDWFSKENVTKDTSQALMV